MLKIVSIVIILFTTEVTLIYSVMSVQKPQNLTIFDFKEPFYFNCSTDVASSDGMDWIVRIKGIYERICSSSDFYLTSNTSCLLNYSMEVPNNRTLNLIVDPRIATLGDEYCCQFDNGAGKKSCSHLTISRTSFVTRPENKTFLKGQSLHFSCVTDSVPDSGIEWFFTSFLNPLSKHHVVKWHNGLSVVQQGFAVERPNNLTSNLIVLNANSSLAGKYCCQFRIGHGGKSCAFAKEISLPKNEVVLPGSNVLLNCNHVQAYRWYRYLPSDLFGDKVIYMGSRMAYGADERFRVYTEPDVSPYDRLDLYINNVTTDLFGTYKCQQPGAAHCAEIIVLESEPVCDVHLVRKLGVFLEKVELTCTIEVTKNAEPEMLCRQNTTEYQKQSVCSKRPDGIVTCTAEVPIGMLPDVTCTIKFNPKPLQKYVTCIHVSSQPSYTFRWVPPYDDELLQSNLTWMVLIICLIIIAVASLIMLSVLILVCILRGRCVRKCFFVHSSSSSSCSTESESFSTDSLEKPKILDECNACIVDQHQQQKEVENGKLISLSIDIPD